MPLPQPSFGHEVDAGKDTRVFLLLGICSILIGVASMLTGETLGGIGRVLHREEEPKQFWSGTVMWYLGSIVFIALYFFG